ncbi:electron transfer flavoprotein subunit alpha/FixB family protein [Methylophaga sp.]|jgi:electron transfer flavoprotein alpha subunit|uniref:electron transfer flavoprotein subunit alpha/FixB family protein n=1 Tax=Methylophaga sp. TaxID=2024840 RepID=UPI0013FEA5BE|nr:electron transfer flavoprotein subunit alpha/FixB family protein [Methylophaga sp.]MTI62422.1 electron transfer flavoprotein subunit alpha/FixB family protein [Methylophaga sp.]
MKTILVVAESRQNELRPISLEVISAAQSVREADDKVVVAIIGQQSESYVDDLSLKGVDEVVAVKVSSEDFDADIHEAAVTSLMENYTPDVVLLPHSVDSLGYAPTLARKGNYGFATDVFKLEYDGQDLVVTRAGYNEKVHVEMDFPGKDCVILTIRSSVFKAVEESGSPSTTSLDMTNIGSRCQNVRYVEPEGADDIDITSVDFIMSIGRGIGEESNVDEFREMADLSGATLCCSRPIADSGWLPKSRQVGQSGKVVGNCKLYVAMGISGSIQHMAGMKHVPTIVAVNTDPGASIFTIAKYGIVGDIFEIEEELRTHFE